jgi:bacterioferritin-associated ferredoxin
MRGGGSEAASAGSSMIVCSCNVPSDHEIRNVAMAGKGQPPSTHQIYGCLGCNMRCGRRARIVKQILSEALIGRSIIPDEGALRLDVPPALRVGQMSPARRLASALADGTIPVWFPSRSMMQRESARGPPWRRLRQAEGFRTSGCQRRGPHLRPPSSMLVGDAAPKCLILISFV